MAEGNAGVFDYAAIRAKLREKGYRPIYAGADWVSEREECRPSGEECPISCSDPAKRPANCRINWKA